MDQITPAIPSDLAFVVIGYNEAAHLRACLESIQNADLDGLSTRVIYVDAGSSDNSVEVARAAGAQECLGGERRRRAAENRNLGWRAANAPFVQFLDGDMVLDREWIAQALPIIKDDASIGVIFGALKERNTSLFYQALQIDWETPEGPANHCGGAALFRREVLEQTGGFPEDVAYGEEPYLCYRIRNDLHRVIYHLPQPMAGHDLAYKGFWDYWRRNIRVGETYAEIAERCRRCPEKMWLREVIMNVVWAGILIGIILLTLLDFVEPPLFALVVLALPLSIIGRKTIQQLRRRRSLAVSLVYAVHIYASKLSIAYGILRWHLRHRSAKAQG